MNETYTFLADLQTEMPDIPADSIISRTLFNDDQIKLVLFGFAAGQELSEHTASQAATLFFIQGEARLTLGGDTMEARPGTWVHMPPGLPHSVQAKTPTLMALTLLKRPAPA